MPRPSKKAAEEKAKAAVGVGIPPPMVMPTLANPVIMPPAPIGMPGAMGGIMPPRVVDNDSFMRVRDSVSFDLHFHWHQS